MKIPILWIINCIWHHPWTIWGQEPFHWPQPLKSQSLGSPLETSQEGSSFAPHSRWGDPKSDGPYTLRSKSLPCTSSEAKCATHRPQSSSSSRSISPSQLSPHPRKVGSLLSPPWDVSRWSWYLVRASSHRELTTSGKLPYSWTREREAALCRCAPHPMSAP